MGPQAVHKQSRHADRYFFITVTTRADTSTVRSCLSMTTDDYGVTRTEFFFSRARRRSWHHDRGWLCLGVSASDPQPTCGVLPTFHQVILSSRASHRPWHNCTTRAWLDYVVMVILSANLQIHSATKLEGNLQQGFERSLQIHRCAHGSRCR